MKSILFTILGAIFLTTVAAPTRAIANDRDLPKELSVLEKFLGTWEHKMTFKHTNGGRDSNQTVSSKRSWSYGGSYLKFEEVNWAKPQYDEFQMLITYDVLKKAYLGVIIDGSDVSKVEAKWDEATKTMSFDAKGEKGNLKYSLRFIDDNQAEGTGTFANAEGKVVANITWKQTKKE